MEYGRIKRFFVGNPLSNELVGHQLIPKWKALAVLSSDALSSVAYATEEILIPLSVFAVAAVTWSIPVALAIVTLLIIITISYQQTIQAYPNGGGAYIVAKENLGLKAGLVAGASLLIDYILTVSVSVAAGVENIASAFPFLSEHKVLCGSVVIIIIMLFNLRGLKESSTIFAFPTYMFMFSFFVLIASGIWKVMTNQVPAPLPVIHETYISIPIFLLLRAFSSGCAALTGIEAISNGIPMFEVPAQKNAKITMLMMSVILGTLFLSITILCHVYGVIPHPGETAISLLSRAVLGNSFFYYVIQVTTALILFLAANTSYAGFPMLSSLLAKDRFAPRQLASLGDRLVFSNGIIGLSILAILLIVLFGGRTHHLIPLYAVGVFLSFTLSQTGMIVHHLKTKEKHWKKSLFFNLVGALTTLLVLLVIAVTKFMHGAWMVIALIPVMVIAFLEINRHYEAIGKQLSFKKEIKTIKLEPVNHTAIVPVSGLHPGVIEALRYAISISHDVRACYVELDSVATARLQEEWAKSAPGIPLVVLKSPYRSVIAPLLDYISDIEKITHDELVTVIIPEFVTSKWYHQFLHNQTALLLRAALRFKKEKVITSIRYHLH